MTMTVEILLKVTGGSPLLSQAQLASILDRSPDGLRISLSGDTEVARQFNSAKKKIGRRVYFSVEAVAKALDDAAA